MVDTPLMLHDHQRAALADLLKRAIDEKIMETPRDFSWRIGPSALDTTCDRAVWYSYHWVQEDTRDARMRRLLGVGHETEKYIIGWLRGAGCTIYEEDPNAKPEAKNKQYGYRAVNGHVGAYLDGVMFLPVAFNFPLPLVLEMKSSGTGAAFTNLFKPVSEGGGVKKVKPAHYKQMSSYGAKFGLRYGLYACYNKNDSDLYLEIVELDWSMAGDDERRLTEIIEAHRPPVRLSENSTNHVCKMCRMQNVCHGGAAYAKNCRSCENGFPTADGKWMCAASNNAVIPREIVKIGCTAYRPIGR